MMRLLAATYVRRGLHQRSRLPISDVQVVAVSFFLAEATWQTSLSHFYIITISVFSTFWFRFKHLDPCMRLKSRVVEI